jgi:hypothetical protein
VERKIARKMSPPGPLIERSSCETRCPERISSTLGVAFARIAGMSSGVMTTGKLRVVSVLASSSSYGRRANYDCIII